jgi:hypothetical protein
MTTNLILVSSNSKPRREKCGPGTWLLYVDGQEPLEVHVSYDIARKPHVVYKRAA